MASLFRSCVIGGIWLALAVGAQARPPGRQVLPGHVPPAVAGLKAVGGLPETNRLRLAFELPLRNPQALNSLLRDLYDPASPRYRRFLKPDEFADQFGPSRQDYQALIAFARQRRLRILATHSNRLLLDVEATTADLRNVFHVNIKLFRHPSEPRTFYAPDAEPSVDLEVRLLGVSGLDSYFLPRPLLRSAVRRGDGGATRALTGSGPGGTFVGNDFRAAYAPGVALNGAGQAVALVAFDTYYTNDILDYESLAGIAPVPITNVIVDGFHGPPEGGSIEVSTDIEMAVAMAPGLSQVLVYEAPYDYTSVNNDLLNQIAVDDLAHQVSCSWFFAIDAATDQIFQQMAAQGQSFFNATGDRGAYYARMAAKEGDPFITEVGGTEVVTTGPGGTWKSEEVWLGSSGGVSGTYLIPYWQQSLNMSSNKGSSVWRNSPDVAMAATGIAVVFDNGHTNGLSGTSCAAPLWAGFMALINEQAALNGQPPVGFLNPALYGIGQSGLYHSCLHDITLGSNTNRVSTNKFFAVAGFDLCTGWGTPAGQALINALAPTDSLVVLPPGGLSFALTNNSLPAPAPENLLLTNLGVASFNWSIGGVPAWLQFSATNGALPPAGAAGLTVTASPGATNLAAGGYAVDLTLNNLTAGVAHAIPIFLAVSDPLVLSPAAGMAVSGPVGGPFNVTSQIFSLSNAATGPLNWTVASGSAFLNIAPGGGTLAPGQATAVTATLSPAASNLLINADSGVISFADLAAGFAQTLPFTLAVGNGGFETGDFSDWSFAGNSNADVVGGAPLYLSYVHSGAFAAVMGEPSTLATLSQSLPTAAGRLYLISFWLVNPVGGNPNEFKLSWNGGTLFDQTNMPKFLWTNMQFVVSAAAAATTLEFSFQNKPDAFGLDDVSVTAIVPPSFGAIAASPGAVLFNWSAMPGFSYQLQSATNLAAPIWTNSGSAILATNGTVAASNAAPAGPQRFYRVVLALP